jgi:hypothetical protein
LSVPIKFQPFFPESCKNSGVSVSLFAGFEISLSEIVEQTEKAVEVMKLLENRNAFELFQIDQIAGKF